MIRSKKITQSAKGAECQINSPICNYDPATTVWCHSNCGDDGKGFGIKAEDLIGCHGCSACHDYIDYRQSISPKHPRYSEQVNTSEAREWYFNRAQKRTLIVLYQKGVITIK